MVLIAVSQSLGEMSCFCIFCQTQVILSPIVRAGGCKGSDDKLGGKRDARFCSPPPRPPEIKAQVARKSSFYSENPLKKDPA